MNPVLLSCRDINNPQILVETESYLLVYKPPKMHSAPGGTTSLAEWCASLFPEITGILRATRGAVRGGEHGLLHRLDYETRGLVLVARNQKCFDTLLDEQNQGKMVKIYGALVSKAVEKPAGFPEFGEQSLFNENANPMTIKSYFRPFGPGGREVRPATAGDPGFQKKVKKHAQLYYTEIIENHAAEAPDIRYLRIRLCKGFRHQIRCHLAWAGCPVLNDPIYGGQKAGAGLLALCAEEIRFIDPATGETACFRLPALAA